jgi:anti-sigma factor RsiW
MRADADDPELTSDPRPSADDLLLQRFLDDELRATERRDLEVRLAADAGLARTLDGLRRQRQLIAADWPEPVPLTAGFGDRLWAGFRSELRLPPPAAAGVAAFSEASALLALKRWSLVAAAAVLLLTGILTLWRPAAPATLQADPTVHKLLRELEREAQQAEGVEAGKANDEAARRRAKRASGATSDR